MSVAVVFPGQGSQQSGAGLPWVDHPAWSAVTAAGAATGVDLAHLLVDAPAEDLRRTREAQLSVLLPPRSSPGTRSRRASPTTWSASPVTRSGRSPRSIAAGAVERDAGLRLAVARADATQAANDANPWCMAALGATEEQAQAACDAPLMPAGWPTSTCPGRS